MGVARNVLRPVLRNVTSGALKKFGGVAIPSSAEAAYFFNKGVTEDGQFVSDERGTDLSRLEQVGRAYDFDGINDQLVLEAGALDAEFQGAPGIWASAWVRWDTLSIGSNLNRVVHTLLDGTGSSGLILMLETGGSNIGNIRVGGRSEFGDTFQVASGSIDLPQGDWVHILGVLDYANDRIYGYVNGYLDLDAAATFISETYDGRIVVGPDSIGAASGSTQPFDGRIMRGQYLVMES